MRVTNSGSAAGAEVAQLYLQFPRHAGEPLLVLRAFEKTPELAPGASTVLTLRLSPRDLSFWDTAAAAGAGGWSGVQGQFGVQIGSSSRDIRLRSFVEVSFA